MRSSGLLEVRVARQEILGRDDRPRLWAVIDEAVIHRVVGGVSVMRRQLRHLAETAQQGKTTIQRRLAGSRYQKRPPPKAASNGRRLARHAPGSSAPDMSLWPD